MGSFIALQLDAPLVAFGGEAVDNYRVVQEFPTLSSIVGLIGNALGIRREEGTRLNELQGCLRMCSLIVKRGSQSRDFKTARIYKDDIAWTSKGVAVERRSGLNSYTAPQLIESFFWMDRLSLCVVEPLDGSRSVEEIASALRFPARPLFIGRKCCIPSTLVLLDVFEESHMFLAIQKALSRLNVEFDKYPIQIPNTPNGIEPDPQFISNLQRKRICDERDFVVGVHGGERSVWEGLYQYRGIS